MCSVGNLSNMPLLILCLLIALKIVFSRHVDSTQNKFTFEDDPAQNGNLFREIDSGCHPLLVTVFMVKNEESVMEETVKSYTDSGFEHFVFFDTGSTDDTIGVIRRTFEDTYATHYIASAEFIDFATSRNQALESAESLYPNACFMLMPDAEWIINNGMSLLDFLSDQADKTQDLYMIKMLSRTDFYQARLVRVSAKKRFVGPVHEVIPYSRKELVPDVYFTVIGSEQGADKSRQRWLRDRKILEDALDKNPNDIRSMFYLAQTCKGIDDIGCAIEWYTKRANSPGWDEENHVAAYRLGSIYEEINDWNNATVWYLKSYEAKRNRVEGLVRLGFHYWNKKLYELSYAYAKIAVKTPFPSHDILFVEQEIYHYGRHDLMGMVGWYVGEFTDGYQAILEAEKHRPGLPHLRRSRGLYEVKLGIRNQPKEDL